MRLLLAFGLVVACVRSASAQETDGVAAAYVFQRARDLASKGEWDQACPLFEESFRLAPAVGALLNLADCDERTGRVASAWQHYTDAIAMLGASDPRLPFARARAIELDKRAPRLTIVVQLPSVKGTRVTRDGVELGVRVLGIPLPVDPGPHVLEISAPGFQSSRAEITLHEGVSERLTLTLGAALTPAPSTFGPVANTAPSPPSNAKKSPWRTVGFSFGAAGLAALAVGGTTGILAFGQAAEARDHCDADRRCDDAGLRAAGNADSLSTVSTVSFVAGAALLVGGAAIVLFGPRR